MAEKPYDLAIVGAGMAGCILAARIAEKGVNSRTGEPLRIALLDRGPHIHGEFRPGYGSPRRRRMFTNVTPDFAGRYLTNPGVPAGAQRRVPIPPDREVFINRTGAIVGGGGLHFTAVTHVPFEIDFALWVEETGVDWSYQNLKAAADEVNRTFNIHAKPEALLTRCDRLFRDAVRQMGYEVHDQTIAKKNCLYSGYCDGVNKCRYDARQGSVVTYLPIAEQHGVEIIPDSMVERVVLEKHGGRVRVAGVGFVQGGARRTLQAARVLVSAGAFGTPVLLMRSGYGPRQYVGPGLVVENPNVGRHVDNRPNLAEPPVGVFDEPLSEGEFRHSGAFCVYRDRHPDRRLERLELSAEANQFTTPEGAAISPAAPEFGREHKEYMRDVADPRRITAASREMLSQCQTVVRLVRPASVRGTVNEWGEQAYQANDPSILKVLGEGRDAIHEILKKMGARKILNMDRPLRVRQLSTWVGSCRGGADPKSSVVDPYFQSHDVEGLLICDASVVPRCASQGYAGTVATVAAFAATRIVARHFKR
ncbi:MAG: GMC family oxidoreductase [Acidobacteria bacterium]|nr:GMC family oxidoreductase [Acidobacteriota bacterium]